MLQHSYLYQDTLSVYIYKAGNKPVQNILARLAWPILRKLFNPLKHVRMRT